MEPLPIPTSDLFQQLGIALLLGLLVGMQREHTAGRMAGVRTFPLITVLGTVSALLAIVLGGWIVAAGMMGVVTVLAVAHLLMTRRGIPIAGTTTEMAMLLMFAVGAFLVVGPREVAIAIGAGVAVLLQFKGELHGFVKKLGDEDLKAIMQFALITCVVLPVLPNQAYGPFDVLNPREIWLMVVLIVGMTLGGYIFYKFFGQDAGILLGGLLGGAISSTATTVSYSRQAYRSPLGAHTAVVIVMIASAVVYVRVLIEVTVVSRQFLEVVAAPVVVLIGLTLVPALIVWFRIRRSPARMPEQENPTQLRSAVVFGLMYAIVLFALAAAKEHFGGHGLLVVAGLSGLTDMDAITLSTARMSLDDAEVLADGWRLIVVAALANLVFKSIIAGVLGGWNLLWRLMLLFSIPLAGGVALLLFWPFAA